MKFNREEIRPNGSKVDTLEPHKRVVSTLIAVLIIVLPTIYFSPLVAVSITKDAYFVNLVNWSRSVSLYLIGKESSFLTVAFGIIAIGVALFALSSNRTGLSTNGDFVEADSVSQYVGFLNVLFSAYFLVVFLTAVTHSSFCDATVSFNVAFTSALGALITGIVSGLTGQSAYQRKEAVEYNRLYRDNLRELTKEYNDSVAGGSPGVYWVVAGQYAILVFVFVFVLTILRFNLGQIVVFAIVALLYGGLTVLLRTYLAVSKWNTVNPEVVTGRFLRFMWFVMWPLAILMSGLLVDSLSISSGANGGSKEGWIAGVVQALILVIYQIYMMNSEAYKSAVAARQYRVVKVRIQRLEKWLDATKDWLASAKPVDC